MNGRKEHDPALDGRIGAGGSADADGTDVDNDVLFQGRPLDAETGLYDFRNRMYHPTLGRWLQRDRVGYVDGMGLYELESGAPCDSTDPIGQKPGEGQAGGWQLGVKSIREPETDDCGLLKTYDVVFTLNKETTQMGTVVQHMYFEFEIRYCNDRPFTDVSPTLKRQWWEAFHVPPRCNRANGIDRWRMIGRGYPCTRGSITIHGDASFHHGLSVYDDQSLFISKGFKKHTGSAKAGSSAATTVDPELGPGQAQLRRQLKLEWDCCDPGDRSKWKTKATLQVD